jgi:hypothetical protein
VIQRRHGTPVLHRAQQVLPGPSQRDQDVPMERVSLAVVTRLSSTGKWVITVNTDEGPRAFLADRAYVATETTP